MRMAEKWTHAPLSRGFCAEETVASDQQDRPGGACPRNDRQALGNCGRAPDRVRHQGTRQPQRKSACSATRGKRMEGLHRGARLLRRRVFHAVTDQFDVHANAGRPLKDQGHIIIGALDKLLTARSAGAVCGCRRCQLHAPIRPSGTFPRTRWKGAGRVARASTNDLSLDQRPTCKPPCVKGARRQPRGCGMPGAGPAFCIACDSTKRGRLREGRTPERRRRSRPVSRVLSWTVIRLGATSPQRSSNLPGSSAGHANGSLFGLAPGGVCRAGPLPDSRCALTAPFHPYRPLATPLRPPGALGDAMHRWHVPVAAEGWRGT